ncbi:tRNA-intron lyase [Methanococcoides methylutens]|uniref:tRNA-splicing endonuclease n=1 Tax=Methanococcoides methylutens MM1 TaxID=1434104 RepID=A0A0E3X072_METMT|nr:tRNA-intron lyase [Methanococcoides methylutens]AKB85575.1 tRNA-intron endonuclease [Methanococcoides methylutens MM1]
MKAEIINDRVLAEKKAVNELYNTGYYGRPKSKGLELTLIEAAYLAYRGKIDVEHNGNVLDFPGFFKIASTLHPSFELKYIVYKDLRERGFYVQPGVTDFRVYPRGSHPGKGAAKQFVYVRSERVPMPLKDLLRSLNAAENVRKQMILAIVDEESDITFYEVKRPRIKGGMGDSLYPDINTEATFLEDRVIIWDEDASTALFENGFYGKPLDKQRLQLSLVESRYLMENGVINVRNRQDNVMDSESFTDIASKIEPEFLLKNSVYTDLREKGVVPKTGFKFGSHFRVYAQVESPAKIPHSEYLVHSIPSDHEFRLPVMSRAVRLANSVRKSMLYAVPEDDGIDYIDIGRVKM